MPAELSEELSNHIFLRDLPEQVKGAMVSLAEEQTFDSGDIILERGEPADYFYLIREGLVSIELPEASETIIEIETLSEGAPVGWSWIVSPYHWQFNARALDDTRVFAFPADKLREICEENHEVGYHLMRKLLNVISERLGGARLQLLKNEELDLPEDLGIL